MKQLKMLSGFCFILNTMCFAQTTLQTVTTAGNITTTNITVAGDMKIWKGNGSQTGNVGIGGGISTTTLNGAQTGQKNTAVGYDVLTALSTTSLPIPNNDQNSGFGQGVLQRLINGAGNTGIGAVAMQYLTTGLSNTAVGVYALEGPTTGASGSDNCAFGAKALRAVSIGIGNVGMGSNAGYAITTGKYNIVIGESAGSDGGANALTTGSFNIAIGRHSQLPSQINDGQLNIQNIIYGVGNTGLNATVSTGSIGIGVVPVAYSGANFARLIVQGDIVNAPSLQLLGVPSTTTNPTGTYLYADAMGVVRKTNLPASGITASCGTANFLTMNGSTANTITCSQITDNGITGTVQIGTNTVGNVDFTGAGTYVQYYNSGQVNQSGTSQIPVNTHYKLFVQGWTASTGFIALSDKRLKKNIKKLESPLSKIAQLNGYSYDWNKENFAGKKLDDSRQAGLLAQEVEKVLPEAVVKNSDGVYGLNYNAIVPLLTEGIKEQQTEIEDLKSEIKELKNKLNQLVSGETKLKVNTIEVVPNPITGVSIVSYKLDNNNAPSGLVIYDLQGKLLKQISLPKNVKEGQVQVTKNDLPAGMYIFALVSGNLEIQSKKVLVSE